MSRAAPTGVALAGAEIARLLEDHPDIPVVIDEAYVDFGGESNSYPLGRLAQAGATASNHWHPEDKLPLGDGLLSLP